MSVPLKNSAGDHLLQGCITDSHTAFWHSCVRIRANLSTAVSACDIWCFKLPCTVALSATTRLRLPFDPPPQSMRQLSGRRTEKVEGGGRKCKTGNCLAENMRIKNCSSFLFPQQYLVPFKSSIIYTFYIFILSL